jgi:hypothetical protein
LCCFALPTGGRANRNDILGKTGGFGEGVWIFLVFFKFFLFFLKILWTGVVFGVIFGFFQPWRARLWMVLRLRVGLWHVLFRECSQGRILGLGVLKRL